MLTQITVSGYKSLQGSTARFAPFTVIVGRNNVGKSNLFDALRLLSHLAQMPAASAFMSNLHRGDPVESFYSKQQPRLTLACDLDLTGAPHPFLPDQELSHPILRYELEIVFRSGTLEVQAEALRGRTPTGTRWRNLITMGNNDEGNSRVSVHRDAGAGRIRHFPAPAARSVLTLIDDAEWYPHIVALAHELSSWRFFHFEPAALRESSPAMDILELATDGRGLPGFYGTLASRDPARFQSIERALRTRGIPEVQGLRVLDTGDQRRLLAVVREDGREFTARVLSDGTLRFLALLALAYAPQPPGLVYIEEPENGVHPGRLPFMVDLLRSLSERGAEGGPRSQVLANSHSPYLVDLLEPAEMRLAVLEGDQTRFVSVEPDVFTRRPLLQSLFEDGEQTLGELWAQGSLDAHA